MSAVLNAARKFIAAQNDVLGKHRENMDRMMEAAQAIAEEAFDRNITLAAEEVIMPEKSLPQHEVKPAPPVQEDVPLPKNGRGRL